MLRQVLLTLSAINSCLGQSANSPPLDWVQRNENGAYQFGFSTADEGRHYHVASATADNVVAGKFGYKDPASGGDLQTTYTAGRRGFRARGPHIARRMDLSQNKPPFSRPNDDGKYHPELDNVFDPNEDRGYDFAFQSPDQVKEEHANSIGDVQGRYSYLDDVGIKHNVEYIAGSRTGFQVTNPVPDTFAQAQGGPLYFVGKSPGSKARGFSAVQKGGDGSYRFVASGPDQKRSEVSDAVGNRRGKYTYLDDKGVQHTVEYIAGPNIGFKIINNSKGTNFSPPYPFYADLPTVGPTLTPTLVTSTPSSVPGFSSTGLPSGLPTGLPALASGFPSDLPSDLPSVTPSGIPSSVSTDQSTGLFPVSPTVPSTTSFPSSTRPPSQPSSTPSYGGTDQKWDFGIDDLFNHPGYPPAKDWSKHTNVQSNTKVHLSTPSTPSSTPFPSYDPLLDLPNPNNPNDFGFLHHQLFPEGLNTAETGAGLKPPFRTNEVHDCKNDSYPNTFRGPSYNNENSYDNSYNDNSYPNPNRPPSRERPHVNVYRGDVRFGGVRKNGGHRPKDDGFFRIPTGVAVRAHVQSLDIVPYNKRFVSPGEALERYGGH